MKIKIEYEIKGNPISVFNLHVFMHILVLKYMDATCTAFVAP